MLRRKCNLPEIDLVRLAYRITEKHSKWKTTYLPTVKSNIRKTDKYNSGT